MTSTLSPDQLTAGGTAEQVLALFDSLPPVTPAEMYGRWRGTEVRTGHPLEGRLAASGWYGKEFIDDDTVHPLLFQLPSGAIFPVEPRLIRFPLAGMFPPAAVAPARRLLRLARPAIRAHGPRARLREVAYRGVVTSAMVYDHLPIIDFFRKIDDDHLLGVMDLRGVDEPYFFALERG